MDTIFINRRGFGPYLGAMLYSRATSNYQRKGTINSSLLTIKVVDEGLFNSMLLLKGTSG